MAQLWAAELGRELPGGVFGEKLTTHSVDVTGALIGERWRVGEQVVLEVTVPRIPCGTFAHWMAEQGWIKRFTAAARPGRTCAWSRRARSRPAIPSWSRAGPTTR